MNASPRPVSLPSRSLLCLYAVWRATNDGLAPAAAAAAAAAAVAAVPGCALQVGYNVEGFTATNQNTLDLDLVPLCMSSQHKFVSGMFNELHRALQSRTGSAPSTLTQFRDSLARLFEELYNAGLHFIKCIRPNTMYTDYFEEDYVQRQIQALALPAVIQLRQDLFAHRLSFAHIASRYTNLLPEEHRAPADAGVWAACKPILGQIEEDDACRYQIGKTRVFMTTACFRSLEDELIKILSVGAVKVQAKVRMRQQQAAYRRQLVKRFQDMMATHMAEDDLVGIQKTIRKLDSMPEMREQQLELQERMDAIMDEMVKEISTLSGKGERYIEYLRGNKRVGPPERRGRPDPGSAEFEEAPTPPRPFTYRIRETFEAMDRQMNTLLFVDEEDEELEPIRGDGVYKPRRGAKQLTIVPLPPPPKEMSIEDLVLLAQNMESSIGRYEKNMQFASGEINRLVGVRADLIRQVKLYIRNYRETEDPEAFLRRIDDFTPLQEELLELGALRTALRELVTRDRDAMRLMVRSTDPQEVYDVLTRSKGIPGLQSEWDLLAAHFEGLRRIAMEELSSLMHEPHPARIYADFRKFDVFGDDCKVLCSKVKAHRQSIIKAAQHRMQDLMVGGGGPSDVREVLELYKDYPEDLDPARESVISYLDKLITALVKRSDQLIHGESIEDIDDFMVRTPDSDFGEPLGHKLDALRNRKRELIQALQLEMKSAARSTDVAKVSRALVESDKYVSYVGNERKELQNRFAMLIKDVKAQIQSLLQGQDYPAVLRMLEVSDSFPPELETEVATLKMFRSNLLDITKRRVRDVLASENLPEIMREHIELKAYGDDVIDEVIALQQRSSLLIQQAKTLIISLMQNREASIKVIIQAMTRYEGFPGDLEAEREGLQRKLDSLVDQAERRIADLMHSSDAHAIERALDEFDGTDERLAPSIRQLTRHRKELCRKTSLKLHSMLHSEDPIAIRSALENSLPFGEDLRSERTSLDAHCSAVLDRANREMEELHKSNNYEDVVDALKKYEQFPDECKLALKDLDQRRELLLANARTAIHDMSSQHANDLQLASDSMVKYEAYPQHIRSMVAQWYQQLIGKAQVDILALVQSENFASVDRALDRYTRVGADELTQDLGNLTRHRDNLLDRTRKQLHTLSLSCEDPRQITEELERMQEYGNHVVEEVRRRRLCCTTKSLHQSFCVLTCVWCGCAGEGTTRAMAQAGAAGAG